MPRSNAGHLRCVPGLNESSTHAASSNGPWSATCGGDYASIGYLRSATGASLSSGGKLVIDVAAVTSRPST